MEQALAIAIKEVVAAVRAKQMSCAEGVDLLSVIEGISRATSTVRGSYVLEDGVEGGDNK